MRTLLCTLSIVLLGSATALGAWPGTVTMVKGEKGKTVTTTGKLEAGQPITDLSWASSSQVACFPATQNQKFQGHHVFFATELPPRSIMTITLTPKDPKADLSLYAYQVGTTNFSLPPKLPGCTACEAEHKWDRPKKGRTQDHTRTVKLNAAANPYNVVIGVAGPTGVVSGEFSVAISLQ